MAAGLRRTFGAFLAGNAAAYLYHLGRWNRRASSPTTSWSWATTRT